MKLMRLRLEMYEEFLTDDERFNIKKHLKTGDDCKVIRDVIVFSDMRLNNLHFLIQKLYNFLGYHLRSFELSDDDLIKITNNSFLKYKELLGTVFQAPNLYEHDLFWNDDYDESISFNKYLKNKYQYPYYYGGKYEEPYYAKQLFKYYTSNINIDLNNNYTIKEATKILSYGFDLNLLSENLRLEEVFGNNEGGLFPLTTEIDYHYDFGCNHKIKIIYKDNYNDLSLSEDDIKYLEERVIDTKTPICINAVGLAIIEDNGSLGSFASMLEENKEESVEEQEHFNEWLKSMGFKKKIGNIYRLL